MADENGFYWKRHPKVENFLLKLLEDCKKRSLQFMEFEKSLQDRTNTRMLDYIDHFMVADTLQIRDTLEDLGFIKQPDHELQAYYHPGVVLPGVVFCSESSFQNGGVALQVENITDFLQLNGFTAEIEGGPFAAYRRCRAFTENGCSLYVVERRGGRELTPAPLSDEDLGNYLEGIEMWQNIPRTIADEQKAFAEILQTVDKLVRQIGKNRAADIVCRSERNYWLSKNYAGRVQKMRQDTLGLGWANHDHHTFRSSRKNFAKLVELFVRLGFHKRERFYAGKEAGWGAQVMENPTAGLVLFLDVDLAPEEITVDFADTELPEKDELGTVGLWCGLHGDSILKAGMHHLAAKCCFSDLAQNITEFGVEFMGPFSNFYYLKQAFSKGETWQVDPAKVRALLDRKAITNRKAEQFLSRGALGSHFENIQRREGYKGFNKKNVSSIIRETDPRTYGRDPSEK